MTVTVPAALEPFVQRQMESGAFSSMEEVVAAGLHLLRQQQETWRDSALEKINIGWSQAKAGQLLSPEQARKSLSEMKATLPKTRR
ncbi:MAG: type II toxin-antitoxin system ParD family antitoxin [Verrucomicrobiales bacterium]